MYNSHRSKKIGGTKMERLTYRNPGIVFLKRGADIDDALDRLAEYEDAEELGLLLRLPCKIGETVYRVFEKCKPSGMGCPFEGGYGISRCRASNDYYAFCDAHIEATKFELVMLDDIGKTIFLTYKEANEALKELKTGHTIQKED